MLNRGDKVVLVGPLLRHAMHWETAPVPNTVYTVREAGIIDYNGRRCCRLEEIVNPVALYKEGYVECGFPESAFRKLVNRLSTERYVAEFRRIASGDVRIPLRKKEKVQ